MPNVRSIKYLFHKKPKRDPVDELFELLSHLNPHRPEPPTIKVPLDKPVEFRNGEEKQVTATFCFKDDNG